MKGSVRRTASFMASFTKSAKRNAEIAVMSKGKFYGPSTIVERHNEEAAELLFLMGRL